MYGTQNSSRTCNNLQSCDNEDEDEENNDDTEADDGGLETGTEQGNATSTTNDDDVCDVTKVHVSVNPCHQNENITNNITRMLQNKLGTSENPVPFPEQINRLNDYTYPSLQALAFPTLFPFGEGDVTNRDRH